MWNAVARGRPIYAEKRRMLFAIACGEGYLMPRVLQRAGKAPVDAREFISGFVRHLGTVIT